jgi:outer membrane immunogenic protein
MRKLILGVGAVAFALTITTANAADLRRPVYKAPPPPVWSWTGFYLGANVGYSWGRSNTDIHLTGANTLLTVNFAANRSFRMDGVIGGGQLGYNLQNGIWVWGIEADIQASGQKGSTAFTCALLCTSGDAFDELRNVSGTFEQKLRWFGTLRGRLGVAAGPSVMPYLTGGLAYGGIRTGGTLSGLTVGGLATSTSFGPSSVTRTGWTAGAGIEGLLGGGWTVKLEYLYIDLGTVSTVATFPTNAPPLTATYNSRITDNIARVGINYLFGGGPVAARY